MSRVATILATGDVGARRADLDSMFLGCRELLRSGDLTFGQLETTVSDGGAIVPNARLAMRSPPGMAAAARSAGYDVMSFAGNHCLDWGYAAFDDTLRHAAEAGLLLCGAGADVATARAPVYADAAGTRVAVIAASSILPEGYSAEVDKPGSAPLRAYTLYEQIEHDQPGTPARVHSFPHPDDLAALCGSVREARGAADVVLVSLHWGIHMTEAVLAEYQRTAAHALIDSGADAILGHHPHILKGVEIYRNRPIFYSLGNFAIEQPHVWDERIMRTASFRHLVSLNPGWSFDSTYMLPEDTRLTGVVRLVLRDGRLDEIRFRPAWIADDSAPMIVEAGDPRFGRVRDYLERISRAVGLETRFAIADGELLIS